MTKEQRMTKLRLKIMDAQSAMFRTHHALIKSGELGDRLSGENEAFRQAMNHIEQALTSLYKI